MRQDIPCCADGIAVIDPIDGCPECHPWPKVGMCTIIPSHFTTQMDMLKSGENNN